MLVVSILTARYSRVPLGGVYRRREASSVVSNN